MTAQFHIEPLPSPSSERADRLSGSRPGSRTSLVLVQDRFPHDDLRLDRTVSARFITSFYRDCSYLDVLILS